MEIIQLSPKDLNRCLLVSIRCSGFPLENRSYKLEASLVFAFTKAGQALLYVMQG